MGPTPPVCRSHLCEGSVSTDRWEHSRLESGGCAGIFAYIETREAGARYPYIVFVLSKLLVSLNNKLMGSQALAQRRQHFMDSKQGGLQFSQTPPEHHVVITMRGDVLEVSPKVSGCSPAKASRHVLHTALRRMTHGIYVLYYFSHPLPFFPCVFVQGVLDYDIRPPLWFHRVENIHPHRIRDQLVFLAK